MTVPHRAARSKAAVKARSATRKPAAKSARKPAGAGDESAAEAAPLHAELLKFVEKRRGVMFEALDKSCAEGDVEAIHDVRVASRRLSEPLRLLAPDLPAGFADKVRKAAGKVRRAFQVVRDLDVMMEGLSAGAGKLRGDAAKAMALVLDGMKSDRKTALADAVETARSKAGRKLAEKMDRLAELAARPPGGPAADEALGRRVAELLAERVRGLDEQVALLDGDAGDPHQVRIAAKRVRYALELADALLPGDRKPVLDKLRSVQELLGSWHDEVVLATELTRRSLSQSALVRHPNLAAELLRLAGLRMKSAAGYLGEFAGQWPELRKALGV
jgi:CHAD domain-containing protein